MRLVKVTWVDAGDPDEKLTWYSDEEVDKFTDEKIEVESVGWVKSDTKLYITICADRIPEKDGKFTWGRPTKIPHGMVVKIEDLNTKSLEG